MIEVEVWVIVDENGEAFADVDYEACHDKCKENSSCLTRAVKLTIKLPNIVPIEAVVELPAESSECKVTVG